MKSTTITSPTSVTLNDVYYAWLEEEHPKKPGLKNKDRGVTDLLNYQRALRCFENSVSGGTDEQGLSPAGKLAVNSILLAHHVEQGLRLLCSKSGKSEPTEKTIKNLIACCRALQASALKDDRVKFITKSHRERRNNRPKRKLRAKFPYHAWPDELQEEWAGYSDWKTKAILGPHEGAKYRSKPCRQSSIKGHRDRLNPYVGYLVRHRGMTSLSLVDLCQLSHYSDYLNWYLKQEADGGFTHAKFTGTTLGTLSQYLVAMGRLEERTSEGIEIWHAFYALSREPLKIGASRGQLRPKKDIGAWKPKQLYKLGMQAWQTPVARTCRAGEENYLKQVLCRKRSALFFILAHETPLRIRNFMEMRWHKNLSRTPKGLWQVTFKGDELKIGTRGFATNIYQHTYSQKTSRMIDAWREFLTQHYGDFETRSSYVFLSADLTNSPVTYPSFSTRIKELCEEFRGETFNPHKVRHIVASYLVNEFGPKGFGLAAELLGDTEAVILQSYYRPNNQEALTEYLKRCQEDEGE